MTANDILITHLPEVDQSVSFDALIDVSGRAKDAFGQIRNRLLEPYPRKKAPEFSTAALTTLCGIDRQKQRYLASKGNLPTGTLPGNGKAKVYTLAETIAWIQATSKRTQRPSGARARVYAVGNFKGGVGKSATTVSEAQALTLLGRRGLIIDCDPQGSATQLCGYAPEAEIPEDKTLLPLIYGDQQSLDYAVMETYWQNLDLIPASAALFDAEFEIPSKVLNDPRFEFWDIINKGLHAPLRDAGEDGARSLLDRYDFVIVDTPPALSYLTINALIAADGILMPCPPEGLDFASSTQFWSLFSDVGSNLPGVKQNKRYDFVKVLMTKARTTDTSRAVQGWLRMAYGDHVLPYIIPESKIQQDASAMLSTIYDLPKADVRNSTYSRLREPLDQLAEYLDDQLVTAWMKEIAQ
ncbi:ParA family protein [Burkholderia pseudomallei]|uniref:ParA-like partition protein n=1 Tax=Burkholderia pseudomallei TaxID=28450 RepID=A0A0C5AYE2_BURPE|nr:AAA family ATPase [Burkholderia pseudomallei]AJL34989.1 ParA-like partition protein [Burkholderia pseudomallei]